jgi:hypothetical protein
MARCGFLAVVCLAATALASESVAAQNARSFVSSTGSDANACTRAFPCRTFARAIAVTNSAGEVVPLDSAGYGPVVITTSVSIVNPGGVVASITAVSGQNAVGIAANSGGVVALRGLTLEGGGVANDGIFYLGGDRVEIVDCVVRNFTHDGINLNVGNGFSGVKTVLISRTIASDNGSAGIAVAPQSFFALRGAIDQATTTHNGQAGILVDGTNATNGGFVDLAIANVVSDSNGDSGITALGLGNMKVEIKNSTLSNNANAGLAVSNAKVGISTNSIVLNGSGFSNINSGTLFTFSDNVIENNRDPNTGALTPVSRQ